MRLQDQPHRLSGHRTHVPNTTSDPLPYHSGHGPANPFLPTSDAYTQPSGPQPSSPKGTRDVERLLLVTLEELFQGKTKKLKVDRKRYNRMSGMKEIDSKILEIDIKPGYCPGVKIKYQDLGDELEDGSFQNVHFILKEVSVPSLGISKILMSIRKNTLTSSWKDITYIMSLTLTLKIL